MIIASGALRNGVQIVSGTLFLSIVPRLEGHVNHTHSTGEAVIGLLVRYIVAWLGLPRGGLFTLSHPGARSRPCSTDLCRAHLPLLKFRDACNHTVCNP